jgi:hypothetical protein
MRVTGGSHTGRLTGLEKCERNVLPVLNNLLEVSTHLPYWS